MAGGPVEIERGGAGAVQGIVLRRCVRAYDENRRFAPRFDDTDRRRISCDTVLLAVGQATNLEFLADGGGDIEQGRPGWPKIDSASLATSAPGVFVAGDLAHGTRLLIDAVASGKSAARSIYRYVTGHTIAMESLTAHIPLPALSAGTWLRGDPPRSIGHHRTAPTARSPGHDG